MNLKPWLAVSLILGFSASSIFAENTAINPNPTSIGLADRITQVQLQAIEAKSRFLDEVSDSDTHMRKTMMLRKIPATKNKHHVIRHEPRPHSTSRKKTLKEKFNLLKKLDKRKHSKKTHSGSKLNRHKNLKPNLRAHLSKREAKVYRLMMNGQSLDRLTPTQKMQLLDLHKRVLKTEAAQIVLKTIQIGEGGGPLVIVGKGIGKSSKFKQIMNNLNFSTHPVHQFPKGMRCFFYSGQLGKCSTASGLYQETGSNYDFYAKQFGLKDFSIESQQIIALDLIRTGQAKIVPGSYKGRGYVELIKGNVAQAIHYGTNDWSSSPYSEWNGAKEPYDKYALAVAKEIKKQGKGKLKDQAYYQKWLDEFGNDAAT